MVRTILSMIGFMLSTTFALAQTDSLQLKVEQLLHAPQPQMRSEALAWLVHSGSPAVMPVLSAVQGQRLFVYRGQPISEIKTSGTRGSKWFVLYPVYKPLEEIPKQSPPDWKEISFSRADRLVLRSILPALNLFANEPQVRQLSYAQFVQTGLDITILQQALAREMDVKALRIGKRVCFALQLDRAQNPKTAAVYIDSLRLVGGNEAIHILEQYAAKRTFGGTLARKAMEAVGSLRHKQQYARIMQNAFSGISLGSILILIALGLSIVYGLAGIINMAHGEFLMIGAYTTYVVQEGVRVLFPAENELSFFVLALPFSFLVAGAFGVLIERLVIRYLYAKPLESLLATWGVSLVLIQLARVIFGDLTAVRAPAFLSGGWELSPDVVLPFNRLFIIGLCIVMVFSTYWMLYRTRLGLCIRAVTQNRHMSACLGIDTKRIDTLTFFFGSGLAGLAGYAMTLIGNVVPDMGQTYIVDSFLVVVTGGVGKLVGTIVSGLGIGSLSKMLEAFLEAVYGKVFILVLIMAFMQYRPKGLFPDKGRVAED